MYKDPNPCATPFLSSPTPPPKSAAADLSPLPLHDESQLLNHHHIMFAPARLALAACSWLRMRRSRLLCLLICSPILLPFLCATFPVLCAAEVCVRICSGRRRKKAAARRLREEEERLRRCEEGRGCGEEEEREVGLLQRYLDDQLMLVGSVYDCGDEDDDDDRDLDGLDYRVSLLS